MSFLSPPQLTPHFRIASLAELLSACLSAAFDLRVERKELAVDEPTECRGLLEAVPESENPLENSSPPTETDDEIESAREDRDCAWECVDEDRPWYCGDRYPDVSSSNSISLAGLSSELAGSSRLGVVELVVRLRRPRTLDSSTSSPTSKPSPPVENQDGRPEVFTVLSEVPVVAERMTGTLSSKGTSTPRSSVDSERFIDGTVTSSEVPEMDGMSASDVAGFTLSASDEVEEGSDSLRRAASDQSPPRCSYSELSKKLISSMLGITTDSCITSMILDLIVSSIMPHVI